SQWNAGDLAAAKATLDQALLIALEAGDVENACRAYVCLGWSLLDWFRLDEADGYITAGIRLAEESEFLGFLAYMHVERARLELARGEWDQAVRSAELGMQAPIPMRCAALTVLGRIAVRRGQHEAAGLLGSAREPATQ